MKTVQITDAELPFLRALLDASTTQLQQAQILTRNELFRPGATLVVHELRPAVTWLQLITMELCVTKEAPAC